MRRYVAGCLVVICLAAFSPVVMCRAQSHEVAFLSEGDSIHAVLFRGSGEGPCPTAVLLHGFPGGEGDVLGIGEAISVIGWNALALNYRGMFRNGGVNTPSNTLADAVAALDYLQNAGFEFIAVDRFAVIGYSYGGWVALVTGARDRRVCCAAGIGPGNVGVLAADIDGQPEARAGWEDYFEKTMSGDPARGVGGKKMVEEILAHSAEFDLRNYGDALSRKPVLLIAGWRDPIASLEKFVLPVSRAIEAVNGGNLTAIVVDDDHYFKSTRAEVRGALCSWLQDKCCLMDQD